MKTILYSFPLQHCKGVGRSKVYSFEKVFTLAFQPFDQNLRVESSSALLMTPYTKFETISSKDLGGDR